jgi:hypothetical protein
MIFQMLIDINTQVASFRDMLIHIGHDKHDCPELRAQIRKTRRACVESCIKVAKLILPQLKRFVHTNNTLGYVSEESKGCERMEDCCKFDKSTDSIVLVKNG